MRQELLIDVTPYETRAALVEEGALGEVWIERAGRQGLVGSIFKGRVSRVLPGMQAAFVEIGLERTAFLHADDIERPAIGDDAPEMPRTDDIRKLVHEGGEVMVQVLKDPLGSKGARLTTGITLPSRYLVSMPLADSIGISSRIEDESERARLREIVEGARSGGGYIVRTAAEGAAPEALRADMLFLERHWELIRERAVKARPGDLVASDLPLPVRVLRDLLGTQISRALVDDEETWRRMREFTDTFVPELSPQIERYQGERAIFDLHDIEGQLRRALERRVDLKSGGYLIFDQTEAMTTIDVNTGAYVGHRNLDETIFKTNLEACQAICRQLRLRNLGGIIIIDLIDMDRADHREQVLVQMEQSLTKDHARVQVYGLSDLGLVQMTRKRTRESLERMLCEPCSTCDGRGTQKTAETVCYEVFREIVREARRFEADELRVLASASVIELLVDEESATLAEIEAETGKPIRLQVEAAYTQEQFDVVPI